MSNLSELIPAGGGQNNTDFVADGAITSGKPVILNSTGTVTQVAESDVAVTGATFDLEQIQTGVQNSVDGCYDTANNKVVLVYSNAGTSEYLYYVVGTVTSESIVWGTPTAASSVITEAVCCCYNTTEGKIVAMGKQSSRPKVFVGTLSGTTITWGTTPVDILATNGIWSESKLVEWSGTSKVVWAGYLSGTSSHAAVGTISGTGTGQTSSWGTAQAIVSDGYNSSRFHSMCYDAGEGDQVLLAYKIQASTNMGFWVRACTLSGTDISLSPTPLQVSSASTPAGYTPAIAYDPVNSKAMMVYTVDISGVGNYGYSRVVSSSGSTVSVGTETNFVGSGTSTQQCKQNWRSLAYAANTSNFVLCYENFDSSGSVGMVTTVEISGTTPVWSNDQATFNGGEIRDGNNVVIYDPDTTQAVLAIKGSANTLQSGVYRVAGDVPTTNLTATNLLGIASAAILDTATGTINTWGSRNEVQTSLTIGSDYYVQGDGTITTASASPAQLIGEAITATQINIKDYTG
jgi:hypothetical protein